MHYFAIYINYGFTNQINTFDNENLNFDVLNEYKRDVIYMYLQDSIFLFDKKGRKV